MKIEKTASCVDNKLYKTLYYNHARDGMHDVVQQMHSAGLLDTILLPGYIGWSPREGSGIFDSIAGIPDIEIKYYKMTTELCIDKDDLYSKISEKNTLVLLVNYFGFRDPDSRNITEQLRKDNVWTMEDNAHGFYTWHESKRIPTDLVVFSLHKMFPFANGGSLVIQNEMLNGLDLSGKREAQEEKNPYVYHIHEIAETRKSNYVKLVKVLEKAEEQGVISSLRKIESVRYNIPQTYPIIIKKGNRDKIYQMMNDAGYGVVSLYHTMIEPLCTDEFTDSLYISKHILNLPVHQDVNAELYDEMVTYLIQCCTETEESSK